MFDLFISFLQAAIIIAALFCFIYICVKYPKFLVMVIFVATILIGIVVCPSVAEEAFIEKEGVITRVAPELFNNYPILVVTVETFDGNVYTYYSEDEIDTEGIVTLTLFGDEVLNVE